MKSILSNCIFIGWVIGTVSLSAWAEKIFKPLINSGRVKFAVGYSLGTHNGLAKQIDGSAIIDENDKIVSLELSVPIQSMSTGNALRDCHMRESLGIDYTNSRFPGEHVCDSNNEVPTKGADSIVYPNVTLQFLQFDQALSASGLSLDSEYSLPVSAKIQVHGKIKTISGLIVKVVKSINSANATQYQVKSLFTLDLRDFGAVVKPIKLGPVKIGVDDQVNVDIDLTLVEKK